jgi:hypothetical protein
MLKGFLSTTAAVLLVSCASDVSAAAIVVSAIRSTSATATAHNNGAAETDAGDGVVSTVGGAFEHEATAEAIAATAVATAWAYQESFVSDASFSGFFRANGSAEIGDWSDPRDIASYESASRLNVTFQLLTPHTYRYTASADWSGDQFAAVHLAGPGLDLAPPLFGSVEYDGTLGPGAYTLFALTGATTSSFNGLGATALFTLTLAELQAVPEPTSLLLVGIGALGLLTARRFRRRV